MRYGASTFIWVSPFSSETLDLIGKVADFGFDLIEICVEEPAAIDTDRIRRRLDDAGIGVTVCGAFGPDRDMSAADEAVRDNAGRYLASCIDIAARLGSEVVLGPMYAGVGNTQMLDPAARRAQWDRAVAGLGRGRRSGRGLRRDARVRAAEPLRDRPRQHRRPRAQADRRHRPSQRRLSSRHVPHEHRGKGHPGRDPPRRPSHRRVPRLFERPRHAGRGPSALAGDRRGSRGDRLCRTGRHRGLHAQHQGDRQGRVAVAPPGPRARMPLPETAWRTSGPSSAPNRCHRSSSPHLGVDLEYSHSSENDDRLGALDRPSTRARSAANSGRGAWVCPRILMLSGAGLRLPAGGARWRSRRRAARRAVSKHAGRRPTGPSLDTTASRGRLGMRNVVVL